MWRGQTQNRGNYTLGPVSLHWAGWKEPAGCSKDGLILVLDGIFYNKQELNCGGDDIDVFCVLYQKYGFLKALEKVNGDFAIALFDSRTSQLWLGRDRLGLKPLYYALNKEYFAFASVPTSLLRLPGVSPMVNPQYVAMFAACHYRYFDNRPSQSPYQDVCQLPAAHALCYDGQKLEKFRYWTLAEQGDLEGSEEELAERYRDLLLDAVSIRLKTVRNPAFTLSGGMDSSSVLASAVNASGQKHHAFSTVYTDKTFDESDDIQSMLAANVEQWHPVLIENPDLFDTIDEMIAVHGEPVATATWLSHYLLSREVHEQGFDSLFGGLGGDELNAGEYEYFFYHFADLKYHGKDGQLEHEIKKWIQYHDHPIHKKSAGLIDTMLKTVVDMKATGRCLPEMGRYRRYAETLNPDYFDMDRFDIKMDHPFLSYLKNRTFQDIFRETAPCCLRAEDRHAEAFQMDHFLPFFDYRLVEFMFRIPGKMKIRDGVTKRLLREAMKGVLPEETRTRVKKTGWNAPAHVWFTGHRLEQLKDLVHSRPFGERGIYNCNAVARVIAEHEQIVLSGENRDNHMMFLWQLLNLELWLRQVDRIREERLS